MFEKYQEGVDEGLFSADFSHPLMSASFVLGAFPVERNVPWSAKWFM